MKIGSAGEIVAHASSFVRCHHLPESDSAHFREILRSGNSGLGRQRGGTRTRTACKMARKICSFVLGEHRCWRRGGHSQMGNFSPNGEGPASVFTEYPTRIEHDKEERR